MFNLGKYNEDELSASIDGKRVFRLNNNIKFVLKRVYGVLNPLKKVSCKKTTDWIKPDIVLTYNSVPVYISVKSGKSTNLHTEELKTFITFLRSQGLSEESLKTIVLLHYGDGTYDGTGEVREDYHELYLKYKDKIDAVNREVNSNPKLVLKILDRVMFQGVDPNSKAAQYIYFGDLESGTIVSRKLIEKYVEHKVKGWNFYDNIHFGPIILRPHARYAHSQIISEKRRNQVQCNWANLEADLEYVYKRYGC